MVTPTLPPFRNNWQSGPTTRDAQEADLRRIESILLIHAAGVTVSSLFIGCYIWFYFHERLNWMGENGVISCWLLSIIFLTILSFGVFALFFRVSIAFFNELYQPTEENMAENRLRLRFFGAPLMPPPFAINYPSVTIKDVKIDSRDDWVCWLGGPARLIIHDGNALYVERGNLFSRVIGPTRQPVLLDRTEKVRLVVDLHPQVITKAGSQPDGISAWTKDGVRVQMDIRLECQVGLEGRSPATSDHLLYPFGPVSVRKTVENIVVRYDAEDKTLVETTWADRVWGEVKGTLSNYVFSHTLDELFLAEKAAGQLQSQEVLQNIFDRINTNLFNIGTRLLSLQITNITPVDPQVNIQRVRTWEAMKQSSAAVTKGQAEANQILSIEKARAEAERDLIDAIIEGLRNTNPALYDKQLILSLSGILEQSLNDSELVAYIPGETLDSLKKLRELLRLP
jgi:hypothetical protein